MGGDRPSGSAGRDGVGCRAAGPPASQARARTPASACSVYSAGRRSSHPSGGLLRGSIRILHDEPCVTIRRRRPSRCAVCRRVHTGHPGRCFHEQTRSLAPTRPGQDPLACEAKLCATGSTSRLPSHVEGAYGAYTACPRHLAAGIRQAPWTGVVELGFATPRSGP